VISIDNSKIPEYVTHVTSTLINNGYEVFLVGGCVRDLIMDRTPKDWDITTNAEPEQIINLFEKTVYKNEFGTVIVCIPKDNYQEGVT
jgi:tRNA nucleotidyltransferase (CCA-adding enzyme)